MWNPSDLPGSLGAALQRMLRVGMAVGALALSGPALAQEPAPAPPAPPAAPAAPAEGRQDLRQIIEKSYEVLPLHNGVVLRPRKERLGVRTIELSGATIAVNGERVTEGVLSAWLAGDADPVLRLHRLPARERQALFGLQAGGRAAEVEEAIPGEPDGETEIPAEGELPAEGEPPAEAGETDIPETPVPPEEPEDPDYPASATGSKVNLFGGITVEKDELAEEAVALMGSVRVDGEVIREVTAVGGSVIINGRVGGEVTAVGGGVRLGPQAVVDGDVTSVGGSVVREEGAKVHGQISEVAMVPYGGGNWDDDFSFGPWTFFSGMDLLWRLAGIGVLALLACLVLMVARPTLDKVELQIEREPWLAGGVGLLTVVLLTLLAVPVTILLIITIVGCVLIALYPFLLIALWLAAFVGYSAVAHRVGRLLEARFDRRFGSPYAVVMVGVVAIEALSVLGAVIGLGGGFLDFIAFGVLTLGFLVRFAAWMVGFGAVLLARFGSSRGGPVYAMAPPPPPPAPVPYDPVLDEPGPDRSITP